jgi:hypothetical protein
VYDLVDTISIAFVLTPATRPESLQIVGLGVAGTRGADV